jgi:glucokinase
MSVLALDLGGTKLATAVFTSEGDILYEETILLESRTGKAAGDLILFQAKKFIELQQVNKNPVKSIGISVPGISNMKEGTVWAPNIPGWEAYPLKHEIKHIAGNIPMVISGDRNCYIAGEHWKGNAKNCSNAIFIAVGTGIGAGIMTDGRILNGANGIAGAIGWMALERPYKKTYDSSGCFESMASGTGIVVQAKKMLEDNQSYTGLLKAKPVSEISTHDVFDAYSKKDEIAVEVFKNCIEMWGMATANLVSIFNPEKIIFGGGIFGPAIQFIPAIEQEARNWAQPVSIQKVSIKASTLGAHAGLYGAAWQAIQLTTQTSRHV